nr:hypothetical protein [Tanacetum cinerariifolium]
MTPLLPHDQRHLWLHYQVKGYTQEIVHDFEQSLETIFGRQVNRVHILDFEGLTRDMRQDLAERMRMVYTGDDGQERRDGIRCGWDSMFQTGGARRSMTWRQFILALGLHTAKEMAEDEFGVYWYTEGMKSGARLSKGHFIGRLAHHFGLVAAAGTPGVAEDAPAVNEGDQALSAPVQAPQQPPSPPHAAVRTIPQILGRLEEEVHGLHKDVRSLSGLEKRSMTDEGRFSTWMISCMAQLMDASGLTYQTFDGTFQGSSPAAFQRRVRQRTGKASTSATP